MDRRSARVALALIAALLVTATAGRVVAAPDVGDDQEPEARPVPAPQSPGFTAPQRRRAVGMSISVPLILATTGGGLLIAGEGYVFNGYTYAGFAVSFAGWVFGPSLGNLYLGRYGWGFGMMGGRLLVTGLALTLMYLPFTEVMQPDRTGDPEEQLYNPVAGLFWGALRFSVFLYGAIFSVVVVGAAIADMALLTRHVKSQAARERRARSIACEEPRWWIAPVALGRGRSAAPGLAVGARF